jgi:dienelactone hydrolase
MGWKPGCSNEETSMRIALKTIVVAALLTACSRPAVQSPGHVVDVAAPDGVTLKGTLFPSAAPGPAMLLLHQCDDRRTVWDPLGQRLAAAGITALAIDYRGFGESGGPRYEALSNEQKAAVTTDVWPGDFDAALAFLSRQPGVDASRMGAAGGSCGVNNVIHLAQRHANVKALVLLAGPADREARTFIEAPSAPPVFTAAAADDRYADFVLVSSWQAGISPRPESRFAQYRDGGHAAVVFRTHPELADLIVQWSRAVLNNLPASLPSTNGVPLAPAVLEGLKAIETPGGAAATHPLLPEYIVNWIGYEHLGLKDTGTALRIMKANAATFPKSANAQDSLADALIAAGDDASAMTAAKRTLELLDADTSMTPQQRDAIHSAAEAKIARLSKR